MVKKFSFFQLALSERYSIIKKRGYTGTFNQWLKTIGIFQRRR